MYEEPEYWVGKTVKCVKHTRFVDSTTHEEGETIYVTPITSHYFSLFSLPSHVRASMLIYTQLEKFRYVEVSRV